MTTLQSVFDRFAISLSALCALHCVAMPVLITLFPTFLATSFDEHSFHLFLVFVVVPSSILALFLGCKKHKNLSVLAFGITGLLGLVLIALFGHDLLGETGEKVGTVLSSLLIVFSHVRNFRLCRKRQCAH